MDNLEWIPLNITILYVRHFVFGGENEKSKSGVGILSQGQGLTGIRV